MEITVSFGGTGGSTGIAEVAQLGAGNQFLLSFQLGGADGQESISSARKHGISEEIPVTQY